MFNISLVSIVLLRAQAAEAEAGNFDDLGKLLLGGLLSAIGVAVVVVFIKMKAQGKEGASNDFVSISPNKQKDPN
jgi:hypothetical protein